MHAVFPLLAPMSRDQIIRGALWSSVALNALGVFILAPLAIGRPSLMWPIAAPPYYAGQIAFTIALFGIVYGWQAMQRTLNRPLIVVGAIGKAGFFFLTAAYALRGDVPTTMAFQATPDIALALVYLWWARGA